MGFKSVKRPKKYHDGFIRFQGNGVVVQQHGDGRITVQIPPIREDNRERMYTTQTQIWCCGCMAGTIQAGLQTYWREWKKGCPKECCESKTATSAAAAAVAGAVSVMGGTLSLEDALASLEEEMLPQPSIGNLVDITCMCIKERNLALRLHAYMCRSGLDAHTSLGSYLVSMLVEAGSICNAQKVFDRLVSRSEGSWDALINGYIKGGESWRALNLYQKFQEDSLHLSEYTYVALLKACAKLKDVESGCKIHAQIVKNRSLEGNLFVGTALVDMYAKSGMLAKAQEVFNELPIRDVVLWNALIAGYVQHERGEEALNCFEQMQLQGFSPNAVTFTCSLKACGSIGATHKGREIHAQIAKKGLLKTNQFVGNALVDMYAKCGSLVIAQEVFCMLPARSVVSWNALIAGYVQHQRGEEALNCFEQMQLDGVPPDAVTFACSLKACGSIGAIDKGKDIHTDIEREGLLKTDQIVGNALVDMYAKCGMLAKAQEVFDKLPDRDVVSWSALIAGYTQHECGKEALHCFEKMQLQGVSPNAVTFACSLKACGSIGATDKGREIHADLEQKGLLKTNQLVGNALVDMHAKCGSLAKAQEVFGMLPVRNIVSWNALIAGYVQYERGEEALNCFEQMQLQGVSPNAVTFACTLKACGIVGAIDKGKEIHADVAQKGFLKTNQIVGNALVDMYAKCGMLAKAQEVFDKLPLRDVISWNALIAGYAQQERGEEALTGFEQMQLQGVSPNAITLACSLKACGSIGAMEKGREIHANIEREGLLKTNQLVGNALVDMYAKCGMLAKAQQVFDMLPVRNVVSWTALITGYAQLGEVANVLHTFERMSGEGILPNPVTFISVLNACSHAGLVDNGQTYFEAMIEDYGITPTLEHHICMVDLLGRAGQLDKAVAMMKKTPSHPNIMMWLTVLGACRKWGNVELGRHAFEQAVRLDEKEASAYVCMFNIYADAGMHEDAKQVEAMRVAKQAQKTLGCCWWTDAGGLMRSLSVVDKKHPRSKIYANLEELSLKTQEQGHALGLHQVSQDIPDDRKIEVLCGHSGKLALASALINTPKGTPIHLVKNRACNDCHFTIAFTSEERSLFKSTMLLHPLFS